jgi:sporulation protein YlmC with PRC-barrel domain
MRTIMKVALAGVALAAFGSFAAPFFDTAAWADDPPAAGSNAAINETHVAVVHVFRTADIIGLPVKNNKHEDLGKIDDLVIDMKTGDVRYAAIEFGGVAGFGGKLFAVPWQKLMFMFGEPNKASSRHFMFDVSKEQLENAPGFNASHWPNVADPQWSTSIDQHYNFERKTTDTAENQAVAYETVFRASKIKGMEVRNAANEHLGSIDDMVVELTKGHVQYLALSFGSWFTGGNKLFAVPLTSCTLTHDNNKTFFTVHVSPEALKNAPGFDKTNWPDTADPNWAKSIDSYYERSAQRPTTRQ